MLGRLNYVSTYSGSDPVHQDDQNNSPQSFEQLAGYTYNPNSQILTSSFKLGMPVAAYTYNNRNWVNQISSSVGSSTYFNEQMQYNSNGNISYQMLQGNYTRNFSNTDLLTYHYIYDKSNRLLLADNIGSRTDEFFDISNTYDHDGNITKLLRNEDSKDPSDNFNYAYQSGTNKLLKVRGLSTNDYSYDENGNLLKDDVNDVWDMKYDFRNLLLECTSKNTDIQNPANGDKIYHTVYNYDEAGNRISKLIWKYNSDDPHPTFPAGSWPYEKTEFYVRNISGAEVATYNAAQAVQFWNIWGSDNVGRIKGNGDKEFYIKDHLGSIRCVVDESSNILSSQDFDVWGHKINGRNYVAAKPGKYQFTSKERDLESDYDYFGARYFDSKIGRWGGVEPKYDKYLSISPYIYSLSNPIINIDPNGKDPYRNQLGSMKEVLNIISSNPGKSYSQLSDVFANSSQRFIYTEKGGFIDLRHFFAASSYSKDIGVKPTLVLGEYNEKFQEFTFNPSAHNPEDRPSNKLGAEFGNANKNESNVLQSFAEYLNSLSPLDPKDNKISEDKVYIPYDETDKPLPNSFSYNPYFGEDPSYNPDYIKHANAQ